MAETFAIRLDPDALTIGDLEDFEEGVGETLQEALKPIPVYELDEDGEPKRDPDTNAKVRKIGDDGHPEMTAKVSNKALKYLVWILKRAETPGFSLDDARAVRVSTLELVTADAEGNAEGAVS